MNAVLKKLGLKDQSPILLLNAPEEYQSTAAEISGQVDTTPIRQYPFVQFFAKNRAEVEALAPTAVQAVQANGHLWMCYPKGTSKKYHCDFNRDDSWGFLKPYGYEPVTQIAIDEDWSALRFKPSDQIQRKAAA